MKKHGAGNGLLIVGAVLLLGTAALHGSGLGMVDGWLEGVKAGPKSLLSLTWMSDSLDWAVVGIGWIIAARRPATPWRQAAALLGVIPTGTGLGLAALQPGFFGAYLLLGAAALAYGGLFLGRDRTASRND